MYKFIFFIIGLIFSQSVLAHDINVDAYKSASSAINSVDLSWKQKASDTSDEEPSLFDISLGYSSGTVDAADLNNITVNLATSSLYSTISLSTPEEMIYSVGYSTAAEKTVDVVSNDVFFQTSKKYYYSDPGLLSRLKIKARADVNYIQHNPVTPLNFDTTVLKTSGKIAAYFYLNNLFNFNLSFKKYFYPKNIDKFVADLRSVTSNALTHIFSNEVSSYGDYSISAGVGHELTDNFSIGFNYSNTQPVYTRGTAAQDYSVDTSYDFDNDISVSAEIGATNNVAGSITSASATTYFQFSLGYAF